MSRTIKSSRCWCGCHEIIERTQGCPDCKDKHKRADRPEYGKTYTLTGTRAVKCILNGNTWEESEVIAR